MPFLAPLMLFGLAAVSIPPIIHLLNRRRFQVIDWGAMQFLQISETTRRRLLIEEILLMALRMALIAVMVLALAGPYLERVIFGGAARPNRDVVIVFDGSYSMGYTGPGKTTHERAKEFALEFVNDLSAGDTVAILIAGQQVKHIIAEPTHDLERVRTAIRQLPDPAGGCNWPLAVESARKILIDKSQRPHRDIVVLSDGQLFSWADKASMDGWQKVAKELTDKKKAQPNIWVVNVDPERPANPPNWSMTPLQSSRAVAGKDREVRFKGAMVLHGKQEYQPPNRLRLEIDGQALKDIPAPRAGKVVDGKVPFSFLHRFATPGSHLVSVIVDPDLPPDQRKAGYVVRDHIPGDNRQDFALEVVAALPVLLVDGDARPISPAETKARERGTDYLLNALAPKRDPSPIVLAKVVPIQEFDSALLTKNISKEPGTKPRVLILSNVARLSNQQEQAVRTFLSDGGGVLVTLGERVDPRYYNDTLYRAGEGWLPAKLEDVVGDEAEESRAVNPQVATFSHPALELFQKETLAGLGIARFPRYWKVKAQVRPTDPSPALFSSKDPFLIERGYRSGRVLLCTVPLDSSWRTNLPQLPAFPPFAHELVYYLAGARGAEHNLIAGQVLRYQPISDEVPGVVTVQPPQGEPKRLATGQWPFVFNDTVSTGVYRLEVNGKTHYYVVAPDPRESDLTPCKDEDRERVAKVLNVGDVKRVRYENDRQKLTKELTASVQRQELWLWFLLAVIAFLCGEVWLTRRIAKNR